MQGGHTARGYLVFFLCAFGVPWAVWIGLRATYGPEGLGSAAAFLIAPAMVSIGGFAASFAEGGKPGLLAFLRRTTLTLPRLVVFLVGPMAVFLAGLLTFVTHPSDLAGQGPIEPWIWLGSLTLLNLWTGPLCEEFGWRGWLQPALERRMALVPAALVVGVAWTLWHVPVFYDHVFSDPQVTAGYTIWVLAWSVVLAFVTRWAGGNVLPAVVTHLCLNTQADMFSALVPALDGSLLPSGMSLSIASAFVAATMAILAGRIGASARRRAAQAA